MIMASIDQTLAVNFSLPDIFFYGDVNKDSELLINNGSYHSIISKSIQSPIDPFVIF
jgi:hypothetical protein